MNTLTNYVFKTKKFGCKIFTKHLRTNICDDLKNILPFNKIPAAKGLPLIGTTLDLIAAGSAPQLHKFIDKRHKQFGGIFRERLGVQNAVFVSTADLMRSVFRYEGQYPTHPLPESWIHYNTKHNCKRGLFFMNGPEWLKNRRIMNQFLLTGDFNWIKVHIDNCSQKLVDEWQRMSQLNDNTNFTRIENIEEQLYSWSIDVICTLMFGDTPEKRSAEINDLINYFASTVHNIFETSSPLMNFPPKLADRFSLKIWTNFEKSVKTVLDVGNQIVEKFMKHSECHDGLLALMKDSGMPLNTIKRIFVDLITAAGDTTSFSTQWALYILSQHSDIQEKIRKDLMKNQSDEIPYIKGLIKETLRLYPVAPFIGRYLATDAIIGNYRIEKNTLVLLSLYSSGRMSEHFPDPLTVRPERWIRSECKGNLHGVSQANGSLPFAIGSRSCIGRKIALHQMYSLIAKMITNFHLDCLNESQVDVVLRLVAVPNQKLQLAIKNIR